MVCYTFAGGTHMPLAIGPSGLSPSSLCLQIQIFTKRPVARSFRSYTLLHGFVTFRKDRWDLGGDLRHCSMCGLRNSSQRACEWALLPEYSKNNSTAGIGIYFSPSLQAFTCPGFQQSICHRFQVDWYWALEKERGKKAGSFYLGI